MRRRRMSKQMPFEDWAPPEWLGLAKGLYAGMLRKAAIIENLKDTPPRCPMTLPWLQRPTLHAPVCRWHCCQ